MKKLFAAFLIFTLVFALAGCSTVPKASDVSVNDLTGAIKQFREDAKVHTTETEDGYVVTIDCGNDMKVKANTDKQKHIISADIILEDAVIDYFKELKTENVALDIYDWQNVPMNKLFCSLYVFRTASHIIPVLTGSSSTVDFVLNTRNATQTEGKWTFNYTTSGKNIVITATYAG